MLDIGALKWYLSNRLDIITGCIGLLSGIGITLLYLISKTIQLLTFGTALFLASLIYLLILNKKQEIFKISISKPIKIVLEIVFFLTIIFSILILFFNEGRPVIYFLLISFAAAVLAFSIINISSTNESVLQIFKIFLLSFNLKYSVFYFYGGSGVDYWTHLRMNQMLATTGSIDTLLGKEAFFPIMHIQVAISQIVTTLSIKDATNIAIIIPLLISSICVFLISRDLFDEKIGLIAMLIISISDYLIYWAIAPQTTSFGICLFYFFIYGIFKLFQSIKNEKIIFIVLLYIPLLIITHAVSSFISLITLFGLSLGILIFTLFFEWKERNPFQKILLIYGIGLLLHWSVQQINEQSTIFESTVSQLEYYVVGHAEFLNRPEAISEYAVTLPPLFERIEDGMGVALLIFFAILGSLYWLSADHRNKLNFSIIIGTIVLMGITLIFPLFGLRNILPTRWFAFFYLFLAIMAAYAVIELSKLIVHQKLSVFFTIVTIFFITFFMITSTISNQDSPLWLKNSTFSSSYTVQEIKGAETIIRYSDDVFSDSRYGNCIFSSYYGIQHQPLEVGDLANRAGEIFVWRTFMEKQPIRILTNLEGYYKRVEIPVILGPEYHKTLEKMQKIYENDDIYGYYIIKY